MEDVCIHRDKKGYLTIEYDDSYEMRSSDMHCTQCGMRGSQRELSETPYIPKRKYEINIRCRIEAKPDCYDQKLYVIARDKAEAFKFVKTMIPTKEDKSDYVISIELYQEPIIKFYTIEDIEDVKRL